MAELENALSKLLIDAGDLGSAYYEEVILKAYINVGISYFFLILSSLVVYIIWKVANKNKDKDECVLEYIIEHKSQYLQ